jgi:hypothetical protein
MENLGLKGRRDLIKWERNNEITKEMDFVRLRKLGLRNSNMTDENTVGFVLQGSKCIYIPLIFLPLPHIVTLTSVRPISTRRVLERNIHGVLE